MSDLLPDGWTQDKIDEQLAWQAEQRRRTQAERGALSDAPFAEAVAVERAYQDRTWGGPPHDRSHTLPEWALILNREVGEVNDEVGNVYWRSGFRTALRAELIQVAAVCAAMVDVLDAQIVTS